MAEFAAYPKYLVKGEEGRIVADEREEEAAISAGFEFQGSDATPAAEPSAPAPAAAKFIEYPKMLVRGDEHRVVEDGQGEAMARQDGFRVASEVIGVPDINPAATPVLSDAVDQSGEVTKLQANLAAAEELIGTLDEAGARVADERDAALKALDEAKAEIEALKAELAKAATDPKTAVLKAELADLGIEYDGRIKDPVKLAKILADAKAATDPEA